MYLVAMLGKPTPSQYQLKLDSSTTSAKLCLNGASADNTALSLFGNLLA